MESPSAHLVDGRAVFRRTAKGRTTLLGMAEHHGHVHPMLAVVNGFTDLRSLQGLFPGGGSEVAEAVAGLWQQGLIEPVDEDLPARS